MKYGNTRHTFITPTISASPAYSAGDAVGGAQAVGPLGSQSGRGVLKQVALADAANQKPELTLLFFRSSPTGTYTDNAAAAPSAADRAAFLGFVAVVADDWVTVGTQAFACKECALGLVGDSDHKVYCVPVAVGAPDFAAADDLDIALTILCD